MTTVNPCDRLDELTAAGLPFDDETVLASIRAALAFRRSAIPPEIIADIHAVERTILAELKNFRMHTIIEAVCDADECRVKHPALKSHALLRSLSSALLGAAALLAVAVKRQSGETLDPGRFALVAYKHAEAAVKLPWSPDIDELMSLKESRRALHEAEGETV